MTDDNSLPTNVKRFDCGNGNAPHCMGCYQMEESNEGDYVEIKSYRLLLRLAITLSSSLRLANASLAGAHKERTASVAGELKELESELKHIRGATEYIYQRSSRAPFEHSFDSWSECTKEEYEEYEAYKTSDSNHGWVYGTRKLIVVGD